MRLFLLGGTLAGCSEPTPAMVGRDAPGAETTVDAGARVEVVEPPANVAGRWAMFTFEDPLAVELTQRGDLLEGMGCAGGLPADPSESRLNFCASLVGKVVGRHVQFTLTDPMIPYQADVFISSDGQRMNGRFHNTGGWTSAMAWRRIGASDRWLPVGDAPALIGALTAKAGQFELRPVGAPPSEVEADTPFLLTVLARGARGLLGGTLGSFCTDEMTWTEATQTLVAGPVLATSPKVPIRLAITFDGQAIRSVEATLPSGSVHAFTATRL